jgi:hypothetical protein
VSFWNFNTADTSHVIPHLDSYSPPLLINDFRNGKIKT